MGWSSAGGTWSSAASDKWPSSRSVTFSVDRARSLLCGKLESRNRVPSPSVDWDDALKRGSSANDSTDKHELVQATEKQPEAKLQDPKVVSALASYSSSGDD
jgi:hypothetical protein